MVADTTHRACSVGNMEDLRNIQWVLVTIGMPRSLT